MPRQRPIRLEDLFALRAVGRVAIAPDGGAILFELKRADPAENQNFTQILRVEVATGRVSPLTREGRHSDTLPKWSPDGRWIGFVSTREKPAGLYVLPTGGGDARRVTDREGAVGDFDFSPDGRRVVYTYHPLSEREKLERDGKSDEVRRRPQFKHYRRLHHKLDGVGWWNGHHRHVWIAPVEGGRAKQLSSGEFDDDEPRFSPDGRSVSFVSNRVPDPDLNHDNADVYVVRAAGGAARRVTQMTGPCRGHSWSPDGARIAFIGSPARQGETWKYNERVWVVESRGGKPRELTREIDQQCFNLTLGDVTSAGFIANPPIWSADGSRVWFVVSEGGATRLYSRGLHRADLRCEVGGEINVMFAQRTARDGAIALSLGTATDPGDVYVLDTARGGAARRLTQVNEALLSRLAVVQPEPFRVRSGTATVHGWVMRPPGFDKRRRYPAILQIHGGPHAQYGFSFFHEMQLMAARGYVVAFSNPRGSAGYGLKFMNCIHADWGNLDYKDVMKVADWLFARPYVDRARVGVTGGSYGGYMTNWIVAHSERFRAAVTQRSVVNLESMFGTSDYGWELGHEFGGTPWKNVAELRRQSPITYITSIRTPLLIEHEEDDLRCPIEQAEQLFTALRVLGREVEFVRFEGESHGLSRGGRPQNRAERLRRIIGWFDRWMPAGKK